MKNGFVHQNKVKSNYIYCSPHFLFGQKIFLNSVFISVEVICCFWGIW